MAKKGPKKYKEQVEVYQKKSFGQTFAYQVSEAPSILWSSDSFEKVNQMRFLNPRVDQASLNSTFKEKE
jgi:hypothetical protein